MSSAEDMATERMFNAAISVLASIDRELGIGVDGCGGPEETLNAIRVLKVAASPLGAAFVEATELFMDRHAKSEIKLIVAALKERQRSYQDIANRQTLINPSGWQEDANLMRGAAELAEDMLAFYQEKA